MSKGIITWVVVLVAGAVIGTFLGQMIGMLLSEGSWQNLLVKGITDAGLQPATIDLKIIRVTFGVTLCLTPMTIIGVIVAAYLFRLITK